MIDRSERRRRRRRQDWIRWLVRIALVVLVFAVGVAVGEALNDNADPGSTITYIHTLPTTPQP